MGGQSTGFTWTPTKRRAPIAAEFSTPGPASIGLPSTFAPVGKGSNATVKSRSPAFTISGRHEIKLNKAGPGPGQYNINGLSYKAGKDEPHAPSMHIRPKDPRPFITPAPGDYCPEKCKKVLDQSPKFSFGVKTEPEKGADIPAPNSYNIPSLIGTPKGGGVHSAAPSFTMSGRPRDEEDKMKIPGPGSYNESLVDKYKTEKSPAFSMGQRTNIPVDSTRKPGPGAHSPEKPSMKLPGLRFSKVDRFKELYKSSKPGPGTYRLINMDAYKQKAPSFSIGARTTIESSSRFNPSPNAYYPEKLMRSIPGLSTFLPHAYMQDKGPQYTMAARLNEFHQMNVPGPGTYNEVDVEAYKEKRPAFTMAPKTELPTDKSPKPSPNAYCPEKYKEEGPKYSMGVKLNEVGKPNVPGPGSYNLGDLGCIMEKSPVYTMRPKTELPTDKSPKPAPNAYYPEKCMQDDGPKYTMGGKLNEINKNTVPGPGSYNAADMDNYLEKRPVYTMAPKTELPTDKTPKPSPNAYYPEKYVEDEGPSYSMGVRLNEFHKMNVPGPGSYEPGDLDTYLEKRPVYTMAPKTELPKDKTPRPSPNAYHPEKYVEDEGPSYTMGSRLNEVHKMNVPGPGSYEPGDLDLYLEKRPVYTMAPKTELPKDKSPRPSPNAYYPEKYVEDEGPSYSMGSRLNEVHKMNVPGPGSYEPGDLDLYLDKRPVYTMAARTELPLDKTPRPSPNAYSPEKSMKKENPEFSFGIKHSIYLGKLRVQ